MNARFETPHDQQSKLESLSLKETPINTMAVPRTNCCSSKLCPFNSHVHPCADAESESAFCSFISPEEQAARFVHRNVALAKINSDMNAAEGRLQQNRELSAYLTEGNVGSYCSMAPQNGPTPNGGNDQAGSTQAVAARCEDKTSNSSWGSLINSGGAVVSKTESWRSSPASCQSFNETNAALQRALGSMKRVSGEPEAVKKKGNHIPNNSISSGSSITGSEARTMSMRERGRWGNKNMAGKDAYSCVIPVCMPQSANIRGGSHNVNGGASSSSAFSSSATMASGQLHRVQCLHCGSFSTTPMAAGYGGTKARSQSFRKLKDYSWQQELLQEKLVNKVEGSAVPEPKVADINQQEADVSRARAASSTIDSQLQHRHHQPSCCGKHHYSSLPAVDDHDFDMAWQNQMLLASQHSPGCFNRDQMFWRGGSNQCSCCSCHCHCLHNHSCCSRFHESVQHSDHHRSVLEMDTFSGPLGYVSESKDMDLIVEEEDRISRARQGRASSSSRWSTILWWKARDKGNKQQQQIVGGAGNKQRAGQVRMGTEEDFVLGPHTKATSSSPSTVQCETCGQRLWVHTSSSGGGGGGRLCCECLEKLAKNVNNNANTTTNNHSNSKGPTASASTTTTNNGIGGVPVAGRGRPRPPPRPMEVQDGVTLESFHGSCTYNNNNHHHHHNNTRSAPRSSSSSSSSAYYYYCPTSNKPTKKWRLVKLCRYLLGFPMQR